MSYTLPPLSPHERHLTSVLGDLKHKIAVYKAFNDYRGEVLQYITNYSQAQYIREHEPDLGDGGDHYLGEVFELHYYCNVGFEIRYNAWLAQKAQRAALRPLGSARQGLINLAEQADKCDLVCDHSMPILCCPVCKDNPDFQALIAEHST